jgi:GDP-D-mannose 3',5'-epimerase
MNKILVTGGAGMIGSKLVKRLVKDGYEVSVVDNLWRGRKEYLLNANGSPVIDLEKDLIQRDLSIAGNFFDLLEDVDCLFHLADVVAGIDYVFNNQGKLFRQNLLINSNVIDAVRNNPVEKFIYVGTACSFPASLQSSTEAKPLRESDLYPADPESAYGWSKLMGQYETQLLGQETGIATATLMLHNVYGAPCDFSVGRSQVIPALIRKAVRHPAEEFVVWGSGKQGRAFVHVEDVVNALMLAMRGDLNGEVIQIGPAVCTSIRQIAETIVNISKKDIDIKYDSSKPEGDMARCADYTKAKEILAWEPQITLEDGLTQVYQWISKQM